LRKAYALQVLPAYPLFLSDVQEENARQKDQVD